MTEPSFWDKWEWARAHQKPEPKLVVDISGAARAPMRRYAGRTGSQSCIVHQ